MICLNYSPSILDESEFDIELERVISKILHFSIKVKYGCQEIRTNREEKLQIMQNNFS
jgi:hypothetical protein